VGRYLEHSRINPQPQPITRRPQAQRRSRPPQRWIENAETEADRAEAAENEADQAKAAEKPSSERTPRRDIARNAVVVHGATLNDLRSPTKAAAASHTLRYSATSVLSPPRVSGSVPRCGPPNTASPANESRLTTAPSYWETSKPASILQDNLSAEHT